MSQDIIEVEAWSDDPTPVFLNYFSDAFDISYLDELNGPGSGSFKLYAGDADLSSIDFLLSGDLQKRNIIRIKVNNEYRGAFVIQKTEHVFVSSDEKRGRVHTISGEGLRTWFNDAVLYPERGEEALTEITSRMFNFASDRGDYTWYYPGEWGPPQGPVYQGYKKKWRPGMSSGNPWLHIQDWPDDLPEARWIWAGEIRPSAPVGDCYFRREFTLLEDGTFSLFVSADNMYEIFMDGQPIGESETRQAYRHAIRYEFPLPVGFHVFAAKCTNLNGPAGLLAALYRNGEDSADDRANLIWNTALDGAWDMNSYPPLAPGWSIGDVLRALFVEADTRGVRPFQIMSLGFTGDHDSYGDDWDTKFEWELDIGTPYAQLIEQFEAIAGDFWIDPTNFVLEGYRTMGFDRTGAAGPGTAVVLSPIVNISEGSEEREADFKTYALIRGKKKWSSVVNTTGRTRYGRLETYVPVDSDDEPYGVAIATKTLASKLTETKSASYAFEPTSGCVPWVDFAIGDWIKVDTKQVAAFEDRRVMAIGFTMGEDGNVQYAVEFDTREQTKQALIDRWIAGVSQGTAGRGYGVIQAVATRLPKKKSYQAPPGVDRDNRNPPVPATSSVASVSGYTNEAGGSRFQANLDFPTVQTDIDDNDLEVASFEFQYKEGASAWTSIPNVQSNPDPATGHQVVNVYDLMPGGNYTFRMRSVGINGKYSDWSGGALEVVATALMSAPEPVFPEGVTVTTSSEGMVVKLPQAPPAPAPVARSSLPSTPVGSMVLWPSPEIPPRWVVCDGRELSRTQYSALFSAIGTTYGEGDGSTTFNVPDTSSTAPAGMTYIIWARR